MTIGAIHVNTSENDDLKVTIAGKAEEVIKVLVNGFPSEDLQLMMTAITTELQRRERKKKGKAK